MKKTVFLIGTILAMLIVSRFIVRIVDATVQIGNDIGVLILLLIIVNTAIGFGGYRIYQRTNSPVGKDVRAKMDNSKYLNAVNRYSELVSRYLAKVYVEPKLHKHASPAPGKQSEPKASAQTYDGPRFSIACPLELDEALRDVSRGGDAVRALNYLSRVREKTFSQKLQEYIQESGMENVDVYKAAGIDRRLFSKIQNDSEYQPSKDTCIMLALALKLEESKAKDLLSSAGYSLSKSSKRDLILEYFFRMHEFDIDIVNGVLEKLGVKTLGKLLLGV